MNVFPVQKFKFQFQALKAFKVLILNGYSFNIKEEK